MTLDDEKKQQTNDSESNENATVRRYKFMTTILREAKDRTLYLEPLEKISGTPVVPITRIIVSLAGMGFALIFAAWFIASDAQRIPFVIAPVICMTLAFAVICVYFMLSSPNGDPILFSAFAFALFQFRNFTAKRAATSPLKSFGIKSINNSGLIAFTNDRFGAVYEVRGQMSYSMLPQIADGMSDLKLHSLISRTDTSQETLFTSVSIADYSTQVDYQKSLADEHEKRYFEIKSTGDNVVANRELWKRYMCRLASDNVTSIMNGNEIDVIQYVLLTDEGDQATMIKTMTQFANDTHSGLWSYVRQIEDPDEVRSVLGKVVLGSEL